MVKYPDLSAVMSRIGERVRAASQTLALAPTAQKNDALAAMADATATAGHHIALWPSLVGVHKRKSA